MRDIYRVTVKSTYSLQPAGGSTWSEEVAYCGNSLDDARLAYYQHEAADYFRGYGNSCQSTVMERIVPPDDDRDDDRVIEIDPTGEPV